MNMKMKSAIRRRKGSALVLMMFIVTLLILSGMAMLSMGYQSRLFAIRTSQNMACRVCTDAGLQKAIDALNTKLTGGTLNDSDLPVSIGETLPAAEGAFSYRVIKNADGNYVAESVGARGDFRRTIVALLTRHKKNYFQYGAVSLGGLTFPPNSTAKAYDSQNAGATGLKIEMGTLSTSSLVVTKPGSSVTGNLFCGAGGNPSATISMGGTLTGTKYALATQPEVVYPTIPAGLPAKPDLHTNGTTVTLTPANSGLYTNFCVDSGGGNAGKLVISGGTVTMAVSNFMKLDNNCEIVVNDGSTLIMYVGCNISSMTGASVTYNGSPLDPSHIQIYGTGTGSPQTWAIKAKNSWTGVIYAPNANITLQAGQNMYGSVVGAYVGLDIQAGYSFNYDVNLQRTANIALNGESHFTVKRWAESSNGYVPDWAQ